MVIQLGEVRHSASLDVVGPSENLEGLRCGL